MSQKVVKKDEITRVLFEGGKIRWDILDSKATLWELDKQTNQYVELGTIRFDTYLQLDISDSAMKLPFYDEERKLNVKCSPFERIRSTNAWYPIDEYQLKSKVLVLAGRDAGLAKYFKERIWRD